MSSLGTRNALIISAQPCESQIRCPSSSARKHRGLSRIGFYVLVCVCQLRGHVSRPQLISFAMTYDICEKKEALHAIGIQVNKKLLLVFMKLTAINKYLC